LLNVLHVHPRISILDHIMEAFLPDFALNFSSCLALGKSLLLAIKGLEYPSCELVFNAFRHEPPPVDSVTGQYVVVSKLMSMHARFSCDFGSYKA